MKQRTKITLTSGAYLLVQETYEQVVNKIAYAYTCKAHRREWINVTQNRNNPTELRVDQIASYYSLD